MQLLVFIMAYPLLWCISLLPFRLLYLLSDLLYFVVYRVVGYRRKTVRSNIELALPELSPAERLAIEKKFYHHLTDLFLEMIKTLSVSVETIEKRFVYTNMEVLRNIEDQKSIILMFPHYAGWEWTVSLNARVSSEGYAVYKRIRNPYFDRMVKKIRGKFGTILIETREVIRVIRRNQHKNIPSIYAFLSDQSPLMSKAIYWQDFMGIKVPVHVGAEILAKRTGLAVIYLRMEKLKRGYYQATFVPLSTAPETIPDYGITDLFLQEVEKQIRKAPEYYFWTHKRWKHRNKAPQQ
ncbi:lysophospholipid acyltransferase family protein [Sinomicrobium soli]|uniref:lysophospholipid acyltransferase family protein n=1 Tax=Sinomicrobium sp. N-1-3-6 TaxID=2219864 RepID=UPI000DCC5C38|nr:lysophospholipid acyltransferase family protein [Sinomicrobium sp. N-1-3-6]RAV30298.1 lipid A biosynthesis acyltransferase [Sinomicrobium sp. N-1-3-6]